MPSRSLGSFLSPRDQGTSTRRFSYPHASPSSSHRPPRCHQGSPASKTGTKASQAIYKSQTFTYSEIDALCPSKRIIPADDRNQLLMPVLVLINNLAPSSINDKQASLLESSHLMSSLRAETLVQDFDQLCILRWFTAALLMAFDVCH